MTEIDEAAVTKAWEAYANTLLKQPDGQKHGIIAMHAAIEVYLKASAKAPGDDIVLQHAAEAHRKDSLASHLAIERIIAEEIASFYENGKPQEFLAVATGVRIRLQQAEPIWGKYKHHMPAPEPVSKGVGYKTKPTEQPVGCREAFEIAWKEACIKDGGWSDAAWEIWQAAWERAPKRESSWQPIETLPRDGRVVILYRPLASLTNDPTVTIRRTTDTPQHCWDATIPTGCDGKNYTEGSCYATHWMPLPPNPTEIEGEL